MRLLLCLFFSMAFLSLKAQSPYSRGVMDFSQLAAVNQYHILPDSNNLNKKWSLNKYAGLSSGLMFFNGGHGSFLSAPIGIQLTRQLTNNVYAFAGVSVAPSYFNFNQSFNNSAFNKSYPAMNPAFSQFGLSSKVEMGLMYVNDQKTFSISGSIGVRRTGYPAYQYNGLPLQQPGILSRQ